MQIKYIFPGMAKEEPARAFEYNGSIILPDFLLQRAGESETAWAGRLGELDVKIILVAPFAGNPNTHMPGIPAEEEISGITHRSYPNPVSKKEVWNTETREAMFIPPEMAVPPLYTEAKPGSIFDEFINGVWEKNVSKHETAIRIERDIRLAACDWTHIKDNHLDDTAVVLWQNYRQALRDIPSQPGFPDAVAWPEAPAKE